LAENFRTDVGYEAQAVNGRDNFILGLFPEAVRIRYFHRQHSAQFSDTNTVREHLGLIGVPISLDTDLKTSFYWFDVRRCDSQMKLINIGREKVAASGWLGLHVKMENGMVPRNAREAVALCFGVNDAAEVAMFSHLWVDVTKDLRLGRVQAVSPPEIHRQETLDLAK
jgi:hypothetical protein